MAGAARASQSAFMRASPAAARGTRKMKKRQATVAGFRESRDGHGNYLFSSRGIRWDRKARINPNASTAIPVRTNAARDGGEREKHNRGQHKKPSRQQHQETHNLHSEIPRRNSKRRRPGNCDAG